MGGAGPVDAVVLVRLEPRAVRPVDGRVPIHELAVGKVIPEGAGHGRTGVVQLRKIPRAAVLDDTVRERGRVCIVYHRVDWRARVVGRGLDTVVISDDEVGTGTADGWVPGYELRFVKAKEVVGDGGAVVALYWF